MLAIFRPIFTFIKIEIVSGVKKIALIRGALVLKERLVREHPAFVYTKVDQYPTNDALTVTRSKCQLRHEIIIRIREASVFELALAT